MLRPKIQLTLEQVLPVFVLGAICLRIWLLKLPDINWSIALSGWSAMDWVAHLTHPANFIRDFPSGVELYDKSSFMQIYPLAQQWLGISPESLIPVVILFEIVFLAICAVYFCQTIASNTSLIAPCLFAILVIGSPARDMDLSNFGAPFFWGLFYNVADGLRLLGIAFVLRGRIQTAALLFAASLTVHPIMALMGCAFALGCLLVERPLPEPRRLTAAIAMFGAVSLAWWILKFRGTDVSSGAIDPQVWVDMARAFSFHFFPIDYGTLTTQHDQRILPLLCLLAIATYYLPSICKDDRRCLSILAGLLLLSVLVGAGLLISVYVPIPALIKLALPRASAVMILIALAIAVCGLVNEIFSTSPLRRALACAVLLSPFFVKPGFPVLPTLLLILPGTLTRLNGTWSWPVRLTPLTLSIAVILLGGAFWIAGIIQPQHYSAYTGSFHFWSMTAGIGALSVLWWAFGLIKKTNLAGRNLILVAVLATSAYFSSLWQREQLPADSYRKRGEDYLATQLWARAHTPATALFMVDPTIYYGWRDFSSRSSFGNLREWLHTSWLYDSRKANYLEGKKRFDELGIDLGPYLHTYSPNQLAGFDKLNGDVLKRFYNMDPDWFTNMSTKYGIDYLVLSRQAIHKKYPFQSVFENHSFIVYKLARDASVSK
ncbi:hypothetical protein [Paralcaligenes ginsengisoli]